MKVDVNNLQFGYGPETVLKNVSIKASDRDFLGIIGPNGSGKTTLLRCISRVVSPQSGTVLIDGKNVNTLSRMDIGKLVALVPQTTNVDFSFTVRDMVFMGRTPHIPRFGLEKSTDFKITEQAMEMVGISHLSDRLYEELSGGEKQRVIIARALAQQSPVLLLDEPTAHLDLGTQYEILELISKLRQSRGITVIGVFHDLNLAAMYCNILVLLQSGMVVSTGNPESVITSDSIRKIYGIDALVRKHPMTDNVQVTPYYSGKPSEKKPDLKVHIVCGGGSGAKLMGLLRERGIGLSAGVLSTLDTDYEVAIALSVEVAGENPFSFIGDESYAKNLKLMEAADYIIVADFPVGPANVKNINATETMAKHGKRIILMQSSPVESRDFTGGQFTEIYNNITSMSQLASNNIEILNILRDGFALNRIK